MLELLYLYEYPISGAGRVEGEGAADENAVALTRAVCHEQNNARHKAPVCVSYSYVSLSLKPHTVSSN